MNNINSLGRDEIRAGLRHLSKDELLELVIDFMTVDVRTPITLFSSFNKVLQKIVVLVQNSIQKIQ